MIRAKKRWRVCDWYFCPEYGCVAAKHKIATVGEIVCFRKPKPV